MNSVLVTSPYLRQYAYPSFWHLLDYFEKNDLKIYNPINEINNYLLKS